MNSKLIYLVPLVVFGVWWRSYLLSSNDLTSGQGIDAPEALDPKEPLTQATGCGMGPRVVRIDLGNMVFAFTGNPSPLVRQLARRRLSNEVRCNKTTQLFSIKWNMQAGSSNTDEQYKYDRRTKTFFHFKSWTTAFVPPQKPHREIYRHVSDEFLHQEKF